MMDMPITPHTPIPVLRGYVRRTYWLQALGCVPAPLLAALTGPTPRWWMAVLIGACAASGCALFNSASKLRKCLHDLIATKIKLERDRKRVLP